MVRVLDGLATGPTGAWTTRGVDQPGPRYTEAEEALASISPRVRVRATVRTGSGAGDPTGGTSAAQRPGYHFSIYLGVYL
jgi:hypothetical protein